ncbi:hypothetical protein B0H13DRAFT_2308170 [Mycena leptocephala]|nr:hypothetical protein B0H13DRAFT_2308170 [Mycena leptocephala]
MSDARIVTLVVCLILTNLSQLKRTFIWDGQEVGALRLLLGDDDQHTVYEGEGIGGCLAMALLLELNGLRGPTTIVVDNQAAVWAILARAPSPSHWIWDIWDGLARKLARQHPDAHITVRWSPGHVGVTGNERADGEAKKAAQEQVSSSPHNIPHRIRGDLPWSRSAVQQSLNANRKAVVERQWKASPRYARTMRYDQKLPAGSYIALADNLPHSLAVLLLQLRTGHVPLAKHLHHFTNKQIELENFWGAKKSLEQGREKPMEKLRAQEGHTEMLKQTLRTREDRITEQMVRFDGAIPLLAQEHQYEPQYWQCTLEREATAGALREQMSSLKQEHACSLEAGRSEALATLAERVDDLKHENEGLQWQILVLQQGSADKEVKIAQVTKQRVEGKQESKSAVDGETHHTGSRIDGGAGHKAARISGEYRRLEALVIVPHKAARISGDYGFLEARVIVRHTGTGIDGGAGHKAARIPGEGAGHKAARISGEYRLLEAHGGIGHKAARISAEDGGGSVALGSGWLGLCSAP